MRGKNGNTFLYGVYFRIEPYFFYFKTKKVQNNFSLYIKLENFDIINLVVEVLEKFVPDIYQKSIYDINYDTLKTRGIKCLLFDLDNTLVPVTVKKPTKKVSDLFEDLKRKGFKLIIVSNSPKKRVAPFKDYLCTDSAYFSFKPLKRKYNKIV